MHECITASWATNCVRRSGKNTMTTIHGRPKRTHIFSGMYAVKKLGYWNETTWAWPHLKPFSCLFFLTNHASNAFLMGRSVIKSHINALSKSEFFLVLIGTAVWGLICQETKASETIAFLRQVDFYFILTHISHNIANSCRESN